MAALTLKAAAEFYVNEHVIPNGQDVYRFWLTFATLANFFGAEFRVKVLERSHSREYRAFRRAAGVTDATVRRELTFLRSMISHNFKEGRLKAMPYIEKPPGSPPRTRFYTEDEMQRIFIEAQRRRVDAPTARAREMADRSWYFLWLASETWSRAKAIEELTVGRMDLWQRQVVDYRVPGARVTRKRRGEVAISDALWPVLYEAMHRYGPPWKDDLVIGCGAPRRNPPYQPGKTRPHAPTYHCIKAITKAVGIDEPFVCRHVWRKTGPSHAVMRGHSTEAVAQVLHDTVPTTARHYAHFKVEKTFDAVNAKPVPMVLPTFVRQDLPREVAPAEFARDVATLTTATETHQ